MLKIRFFKHGRVLDTIDAKWTVNIAELATHADELQSQFEADDWDVVNRAGVRVFTKSRWTLLQPSWSRRPRTCTSWRKITGPLLVVIGTFLFSSGVASAMCSTAEPNCVGRISFGPFTDKHLCFAVFQVDGGRERRSDFCLHSGQKRDVYARTGDRFCGVLGDDAPPFNCVRSPMNVP
jgi:hypothetical protein